MKGLLFILIVAAIQHVSVSQSTYTCRCGTYLRDQTDPSKPILNSVMYHAVIGNVDDCGAKGIETCKNQCIQVFGSAVGNLKCKRADGRSIYEMSCLLYNKNISGGKLAIFSTTCSSGVWTFAKSVTENFCCQNYKPCPGYW
ncbi:uncharacterized protein LOC124162130 [Ischnura elegans]|uniref:uncharacterized protein LOC124162130 n=1 Tax=Ischnura elegans TaxID=197161 RepID=UPI001ED8993B|nr:uncharacterized protein LOC124162130 [Ischnura elegans]